MSSSANEDREQRKTASMDKSDLMTIEFLRARLLSERSVSKTARQRADDLANRVAELEEQLKFVSLQREKAEKATTDILLILKNHGMGDISEEFESSSDQEENSPDFNARNGSRTMEETSTNAKLRNNGNDAYSSSEIESFPSTGRSLSWKSTRNAQHSHEKKKCMDPVRRRASFSTNSSSSRRVGKSCRKIKRRDTRSVEELHNDGTERTTCSKDSSNFSDGEPDASAESSGYANGKKPMENPVSGRSNGTQKVNGNYFNVPEKDVDMESALLHQAQLISRYEEEEKAQREWEEKFRENNSGTQDSCDPGNHSDVTEERYETKSRDMSCAPATLDSDDQEVKQEPADARINEEPQTSKVSPSVADADKGSLQGEKCSTGIVAPESSSSVSDFSFPKAVKSPEGFSGRSDEASRHRFQQCLPTVSVTEHTPPKASTSYAGQFTPPSRGYSSFELAVVPQETSNSLGSVMEALQRAKLSLSQKLGSLPQGAEGTSGNAVGPSNTETNKMDCLQIPFGTPGLFKLPTDYEFETSTRANTGIDARPSFGNFSHKFVDDTETFVEPRSALSGDPFRTVPSRALTSEMSPGLSPQRFLSQPRLWGGTPPSNATSQIDPYSNHALPPLKDSYPFLPDITLAIPPNEEAISRTVPSSGKGLPPIMRLSPYDGQAGSSMYR